LAAILLKNHPLSHLVDSFTLEKFTLLEHYLAKLKVLYNTYMNKSKGKSQKAKIPNLPPLVFAKKQPKFFAPKTFRVTQHKGG